MPAQTAVAEAPPETEIPAETGKPSSMTKIILAGMMGNAMEWYAYALFAHMALIFSTVFFPAGSEGIIKTFGIFAIGFIVRPLGAALFGWLGDKLGRRNALSLSIMMMAIPTGCIGLLPTYAQIGWAAPILLMTISVLQGLSMGGAFTGTMTYVIEHAPVAHRGLIGSTVKSSLIVGFLIGSLVTFATEASVGTAAFHAWGWRLPFLFGTLIGLAGFYIRHNCGESPVYTKAKAEGALSEQPLKELLSHYLPNMLRAVGIFILVTVPFYVLAAYFVTYSKKSLGMSDDAALALSTINMLILLLLVPVSGWLSDRIGRRKLLMIIAAGFLLLTLPVFSQLAPGALVRNIAAEVTFAALVGFYMSPIAALFVESFPTRVRYTGMSLAYNISAGLFGGTAPMACEWLLQKTGNSMAIAWYVMACAVISLVSLYFYKDRYKEPLS